jgi:membrane fusion protein, multidrug efflux system
VQKRVVSLGELVKAQSSVMSVVRVDPLKVIAEIPERMGPWVKVGQPVHLQVDAYPDKALTGIVSRISPAVNIQTRAFAFEARVPNGEALLKPGTFARVRLETSKVEPVLTVPYSAMQYRYGVNRAFVVEGDHVSAHDLKTGERMGDRIEIVSGVKAGDTIAVSDIETLTDGLKITTRD